MNEEKTDHAPQFETRALHAGITPDATTGARQFPIFQTTSFVFQDSEHAASLFNLQAPGFIYSRLTNPTVSALEERLASLEDGLGATACSSGHAAQILALLPLMRSGDRLLAATRLYGGSITQFSVTFKSFGWEVDFVDVDNLESVRNALTDRHKAIFVESLANPGGVVSDLESLSSIARQASIPLIVDNTLATPWLCQPFEWGADLVIHSTTKFLSGQGQAIGGVVIDSGKFPWDSGKFPALSEPHAAYHGLRFTETFGPLAYTVYGHAVGLRDLGVCQAPLNAWLTMLGTETLSLRMDRHVRNALEVASFLQQDSRVAEVSYAGLPESPYYELARKYLPRGAGAVFTMRLKRGFSACENMVDRVQLLSHLANVGDSRTLIIHPASTTHRQLDAEALKKADVAPDVVRLSIGLENTRDIIADLDQAMS